MQRLLITLAILVGAVLLTWVMYKNTAAPIPADPPASTVPVAPAAPVAASATPATAGPAPAPAPPLPAAPAGLAALKITAQQPEPVIGSADDQPSNAFMQEARFTPWGGGLIHLKLARYSTLVNQHDPYTIQQRLADNEIAQADGNKLITYRYPMAMHSVTVNGRRVELFAERWQVVPEATSASQAAFAITLVDESGKPVLRVTRVWSVQPGKYDLRLTQTLENLSDKEMEASFAQYGPMEMLPDDYVPGKPSVATSFDYRHVIIGYLQPLQTNANLKTITTTDFDLPRQTILDAPDPVIWPRAGDDPLRDMFWAAMTNRYFAVVLHAPVQPLDPIKPILASEVIENQFTRLSRSAPTATGATPLGLILESAPRRLAPAGSEGAAATYTLELFAGPREPALLKKDPAYARLSLGQIIIYNLGGMCAICTFAPLAEGMLAFLRLIEYLVRDWGVAIIILVALVRLLLHPLSKFSQVNMMKMSKQMAELQPAIEKLKAKYGSDQQKLNAEMMALYKEKGVNPAAMGMGCLPMFLQMPIWFALYAMLYFAIELRHQPAFYGVFQAVSAGKWPFLADLSSQDNFIPLPFTIDLWLFAFDSINLLPVLMAVVFWLQQKYMTPQTAVMNEQQAQQQAMMKWMVLLMPVMLYKTPCGLNLYILASTAVGIVESKRVRAHLKELEASGKLFEKKPVKPGSLRDRLNKAIEARMKNLQNGSNGSPGPKRRK
jgi:YidC/Oxa1 family membrane protein insertase